MNQGASPPMSWTRPGGGRRPGFGSPWRPGPGTAGGPWAGGHRRRRAGARAGRRGALAAGEHRLTFATGDWFEAEG